MSSPTKDEMLDRMRRFMTGNSKAKAKAKARFDCAIGYEVAWPKRPVRRRPVRRRVVRRRSLDERSLDERRVAREKWIKREVERAKEFSFTNSLLRKDLEQTRAYLKEAKEEIMVLREKLFLVERVAHGRIDRIEELERENSELEAEVIAAKVIREGKLRHVGKHNHEGKHDNGQLEQKDYKTTQDAQESILQRFTRYFTLK